MMSDEAIELLNSTAVCVVWFNPDQAAYRNVRRYAERFDVVYVIDNSSNRTGELLPKNVFYVWLKRNRGIAFALNRGYDLAVRDGFMWLLTMDQDSEFQYREIDNLLSALADELQQNSHIGIFAPCAGTVPPEDRTTKKKLPHVLTSGNMVKLRALSEVSGWDSMLFIDHVDHDLCFRLREKGYEIIRSNRSWLRHKPGSRQIRHGRVSFTHTPRRYYFMSRNLVFLTSRYYSIFPREINRLWYFHFKKLYFSIFLNRQRIRVLLASLTGVLAGLICLVTVGTHVPVKD